MNVAVIDADLIGRKKHRFPNLVCMKLSAWHKKQGDSVILKTDYLNLGDYQRVYISKVFTDTPVPEDAFQKTNVCWGGTGFYFDKAPDLPPEIEHIMPDYNLYNEWIEEKKAEGKNDFKSYTDYSMGFTTRGCFRKCGFCVNQKYSRVMFHAHPSEFVDESRKKICLLDDNFLGYPKREELLKELLQYKKPIVFNQGLDIRLLNEEMCRLLFSAKWDGDYRFAFDDVKDYPIIEKKLQMIRKHTEKQNIKFYVLVGYDGIEIEDIANMFKRIKLLQKYRCLPYIMKYQNSEGKPYEKSKYRGIYVAVGRWCNQPAFFKKNSFREFCEKDNAGCKTKDSAAMRALKQFEGDYPEIAQRYFDNKFGM